MTGREYGILSKKLFTVHTFLLNATAIASNQRYFENIYSRGKKTKMENCFDVENLKNAKNVLLPNRKCKKKQKQKQKFLIANRRKSVNDRKKIGNI